MNAKHTPAWPEPDTPIVLDGTAASVLGAAAMCDALVLDPDYARPTDAWPQCNRFGRRVSVVEAPSGRDAVAIATGMALAGERVALFLTAASCAAALDLLAEAAGRHAPLVVHLVCRALPGPARPLGTGHEILERLASTGCMQLVAIDAQDVLDLGLAARRAAERALAPVVVAMDAQEIAEAPQDVVLPSTAQLRAIVGEPSAPLHAPTSAQRTLLGDVRRTVPRWYDLERPVLLGPVEGGEAFAHAAAGHECWFAAAGPEAMWEAMNMVGAALGRPIDPVLTDGMDGARTALVACGAMVETLSALAKAVRGERRKVGILGIRCITPLPTGALAAALARKRTIGILERQDGAAREDPPLARAVRGVLARAIENDRFGAEVHAGVPTLSAKHLPRLVSVRAGVGGGAVRGADLRALVEELEHPTRSHLWLGATFEPGGRVYPKRKAFLDGLRRARPDLDRVGLQGSGESPDLRSPDARTVALLGAGSEELLQPLAALLPVARRGHVRSRHSGSIGTAGRTPLHEVTVAPLEPCVPTGDGPIDALVLTEADPYWKELARLREGAPVILFGVDPALLSHSVRRALAARGAAVQHLDEDRPGNALADERALGAILRAVAADPDAQADTVRDARRAALGSLPEAERSARLEAFERGWTVDRPIEIRLHDAGEPPALPARLRALKRSDATVDCLPRFWDQVGVLYRDHETQSLTPDPYLAAGAVPALASALQDEHGISGRIAFFDPATFDGDVRLWTECAEGAVAPLAIVPRTLIETGMMLAAERGRSAEPLRSAVANLARQAARTVRDEPATTAGALLRSAFAQLLEKGGPVAERRDTLEPALDAVIDAIGSLPLLRTAVLFDEPEAKQSGTGALLTVVMHPEQLRSADALIDAWDGRGVRGEVRTPAAVAEARNLWSIWERLPDTPGTLIDRARHDERFGPLAAPLLSRHCMLAAARMPAERGSGAALALRHALALAEADLQPRLQAHLEQVQARRTELAERIRTVLAEALPVKDLDALSRGLDALRGEDVALADLSRRVDAAVEGGQVDSERVRRLVEVARGLADLDWRVAHGPDGLGRARAGLVIASPRLARWTAGFPENPFVGPVMTAGAGEGVALARGLLEGHVRRTLHGVRLLRWAEAELAEPGRGAEALEALAGLGFAELEPAERALCSPLLLVVDEHALRGAARASIEALLRSTLPVKVLVLDGLAGLEGEHREAGGAGCDMAAVACLGGQAFVAQTALAAGAHLAESMLAALRHDGPALVRVHAPSPSEHGFAVGRTGAQSALAVVARVHPVYTFDPARPGVLGTRLELDGNPALEETWATDAQGLAITPVDWAATEGRFARHFEPVGAEIRQPTPIAQYLLLDAEGRAGRTPTVETADRGTCTVDAAMVELADRVAMRWRMLQEIAGAVTPFVDRIRAEVEAEGAETVAGRIAELQRQHEQAMAALRAQVEDEATERVTRGLMTLAGFESGVLEEAVAVP